MTKLLISFCNSPPYSKLKKKGYSPLGILDYEKNMVYWLKVPPAPKYSGITGLSQNKDYIFASYQSKNTGAIIVFAKAGLGVKYWTELPGSKDVHSILFHNNFLYVVSAGNDQILSYRCKNGEIDVSSAKSLWKPKESSGQSDTHHLNSICWHKRGLFVSAFGPKTGERWSSAKNGYILELKSGRKLAVQIYHPHSIFSNGDNIVFCESTARSLRTNGNRIIFKFADGYTRGLAGAGNYWAVGLSAGRRVSRSTKLINSIADPGELIAICKLVFLEKNFRQPKISFLFDFISFHNEIYDVLPMRNDFFVADRNVIGRNMLKKY